MDSDAGHHSHQFVLGSDDGCSDLTDATQQLLEGAGLTGLLPHQVSVEDAVVDSGVKFLVQELANDLFQFVL